MTPRLIVFVRLLREHGIRISVAESLDALRSVSHVGFQDRELLRLGLRTALVKSQQDFAIFDALFDRFFALPRRRKRRHARQRGGDGNGHGQRSTTLSDGVSVRPASQPAPSQSSSFSMLREAKHDQQSMVHEDVAAQMFGMLADLDRAWQGQLDARSVGIVTAVRNIDTDFVQTRLDREFPPDRLVDMYREVERLAARLLTRRTLRYRRARHGRIDLRRTVLNGLRSGREVPFSLVYRRRHIGKLRLIVLCDVSGSVWQVSTFLLKLVHTLQAEFTSVRSLLFVNSIVEVTPLFRRMRFPQDLDALRHYPNLNLFGFSDFGRAFYQFYRDILGDLSRETVVLILGDARNNAFDPQAWTLGEVRQRCRRIVWLNPDPCRDWNKGDSVLDAYAPHCDHVLECWTLEHLIRAAELLLQP